MRFPLSRFIVDEESMLPAYKPGDHVLTFNWANYKIGDVIVFRSGGKNFIKRIRSIPGNKYLAGGDNRRESVRDEVIAPGDIIGKVILKY